MLGLHQHLPGMCILAPAAPSAYLQVSVLLPCSRHCSQLRTACTLDGEGMLQGVRDAEEAVQAELQDVVAQLEDVQQQLADCQAGMAASLKHLEV